MFNEKLEHLEGLSLEDGAATATAYIAESIAYSLALYVPEMPREIIIIYIFVVFCHLMSLELETSVTSALQSTLNAIEALCAKNALESDEVQSYQNQFISDILDNIQVQYTLQVIQKSPFFLDF